MRLTSRDLDMAFGATAPPPPFPPTGCRHKLLLLYGQRILRHVQVLRRRRAAHSEASCQQRSAGVDTTTDYFRAHLISIVRNTPPALKRSHTILDINPLSRSAGGQRDTVVIGDVKYLTRRSSRATWLDPERSPVASQAGTKLAAKVGIRDADLCRAVVVNEMLGRRVVAGSAKVMIRAIRSAR